MAKELRQTHLGQYSRGVSIIGVGCTPFRKILGDPELEGITEGELAGYAAIEAMKDAGITAKDLDFYYHGTAMVSTNMDYVSPAVLFAKWFGARGVGASHCSSGCCTGYITFDQAVTAVASGKHDIVLAVGVEMGNSYPVPGMPAHMRAPMTFQDLLHTVVMLYSRDYTRPMQAGRFQHDMALARYMRENDVSREQIDETLCAAARNSRINSSKNPLALNRTPYAEIAKEKGFDTDMEYLQSALNPPVSAYNRASGMVDCCEGAAAVILCPTEIAHRYTDKPIEVVASGICCLEADQANFTTKYEAEAFRQAYEASGMTGDDIDILYVNDITIDTQLIAAELAGYLPKGEGWKYFIDGRTTYDGDKPINTDGGRSQFGQAHGAAGIAVLTEAVKQLRGECGERQVKNAKTALLHGWGGMQNGTATIIRVKE